MINLRELQKALGTAVAYTLYVPGRFHRFAGRVLGPGSTAADRQRLRAGHELVPGRQGRSGPRRGAARQPA